MAPRKGQGRSKPDADRRARFVQEYCIDLNATQAAIRAGYAPKAAKVQASRLLTNVTVRAEIDARLAAKARENDITTDRVLKEISRIAFCDPRRLFAEGGALKAIHDLDDDAAAALSSVETREIGGGEDSPVITVRKIKLVSKAQALSQAMAYLGMHKSAAPGEGAVAFNLTIQSSDGKRLR